MLERARRITRLARRLGLADKIKKLRRDTGPSDEEIVAEAQKRKDAKALTDGTRHRPKTYR